MKLDPPNKVWLALDSDSREQHFIYWDGSEETRQDIVKIVDGMWSDRYGYWPDLTETDLIAMSYGETRPSGKRLEMDFVIATGDRFPKVAWGELLVMGRHLPHSSNMTCKLNVPVGYTLKITGRAPAEKFIADMEAAKQ